MYMYLLTFYVFLIMFCLYIQQKDILKTVVIYFDSLQIF